MVVLRFRARKQQEAPGYTQVQVFVGHGSQSNPEDITCGLAGTLELEPAEWDALRSRLQQVGPDERYSVTFMEARS